MSQASGSLHTSSQVLKSALHSPSLQTLPGIQESTGRREQIQGPPVPPPPSHPCPPHSSHPASLLFLQFAKLIPTSGSSHLLFSCSFFTSLHGWCLFILQISAQTTSPDPTHQSPPPTIVHISVSCFSLV